MSTNEGFQGVSNCYVFKSQLQEYAQKVGLPTPVYETIKEGPSHEPCFRSTVIVDEVRYDSLPGFFNRKAAEQSAAEVALMALANNGETTQCISLPVHETGLCKNLLQEYAQKMNYAIPFYECRKDEVSGRVPHFSCTVDIGGIKYIGAAARTKKEAEIKAARTALLAIQSSASGSKTADNSVYTVVPCRKKATDSGAVTQKTTPALKPKKGRFKKKPRKKRQHGEEGNSVQSENADIVVVNTDSFEGQLFQTADSSVLSTRSAQGQTPSFNGNGGGNFVSGGALVPCHNGDAKNGHLMNFHQSEMCISHFAVTMSVTDGSNTLVGEMNSILGDGQVTSVVNYSGISQGEVSTSMDGLNQMA